MELVTEPVAKIPQHADIRTANDWLDAISAGSCTDSEFFGGVDELLRRAPDTGWELLARLDQYYRRGKISAETFGSLKPHLQVLLMGKGDEPSQSAARAAGARLSAPVPRPQAKTPRAGTAPAAVSASAPAAPVPVAPPHAAVVPSTKPAGTTTTTPAVAKRAAAKPAAPAPAKVEPTQAAVLRSALNGSSAIRRPVAAAKNEHTEHPATAASASAPVAAASPSASNPPASPSAPTARQTRTIEIGSTLRGRYRIEGILGKGGMGTVFDAVDEFRVDEAQGDPRVAIKVLHTAVTHRPRLFAELRREFQHLQCLSHPNIVRVHEFDRDGDTAFFTMERLSGSPLSRLLVAHRAAPLYRPYAFAILRDVGAAVEHAHARGVVHGDLNPVNVFVTDGGEIRVLDFGASHQMSRGTSVSDYDASQPEAPVATPSYASCQVLEGEPADVRDDAYSLACVTYVLLTGKHPFRENSSLKARSLRLKPARPRGLASRQWRALKTGLDFDRERRPSDLHAWLHQMKGEAPPLPTLLELMQPREPARNYTQWAIVTVAIAAVAVAAWWLAVNLRELSPASLSSDTVEVRPQSVQPPGTLRNEALVSNQATPANQTVTDNQSASARQAPTAALPASATPSAPSKPLAPANSSVAATPSLRAAASALALVAGKPSVGMPDDPSVNSVHARIELAADTVDVTPGESMAKIVIHRSHPLRGDVNFSLWTEPGTAKPDRDFVPIKSEIEELPDGKGTLTLFVSILNDPSRRESRSFYVFIDGPSENAVVGPRNFTQVTLPEVIDSAAQ